MYQSAFGVAGSNKPTNQSSECDSYEGYRSHKPIKPNMYNQKTYNNYVIKAYNAIGSFT